MSTIIRIDDTIMNTICIDLAKQLNTKNLLTYHTLEAIKYYPQIKEYFDKRDCIVKLLDDNQIEIRHNLSPVRGDEKNAETMKSKADNYWLEYSKIKLMEIMKNIEIVSDKGFYEISYTIVEPSRSPDPVDYLFLHNHAVIYISQELKRSKFKVVISGSAFVINWSMMAK